MKNYPIFMNIREQPCLIVGGGSLALRKAKRLLSAGAKLTIIAPKVCTELLNDYPNSVVVYRREFKDSDIDGYRLITAATNSAEVNRRVSKLAQDRNIPVNVVDQPELCTFITPSMIDRDPVTIAISTGGSAPILARLLRAKLEAYVPARFGKLAASMGALRDKVKSTLTSESDRRRFWESLTEGTLSEHLMFGRTKDAEPLIDDLLGQIESRSTAGEVWLVGAGPGDPDLLTFRALRLMQMADVVLYDRLVSDEILELCRRDADMIYVGKQRDNHSLPQPEINQRLLDLARDGKRVLRLKGGDPFIFGRGGEEISLLSENNIPFQVVPGITAASGCASYAGIPLTHRDHAQSCLFVTGHLKNGSVDLDWQQLAQANQTVVIYMGLHGLPVVSEKLIEHGVSADMPVALIERGTTSHQRVLIASLQTINDELAKCQVRAPTIIIIGTVVTLHQNLNWFEHKKSPA